jgi:hypothetical protein
MSNSALFEKLFLQLSCSHVDNEVGAEEQALDDIDWAALSVLAHRNGVAGFVYRNTKDQDIFPEQNQQELQSAYRHTTYHNLDQLAGTIKILRLLSANGIQAIPLKGVVASEVIFQDLGVYPSGDIDILVHPADLTAVKKILLASGYSSVEGIQEEDLLINHYHLMFHNGHHLLEVHWNLTKRYFEIPPDFWWQDVGTVRWRDMDVVALAPEKYILYTIFRLFDHCFYPLRFLVLIAGIVDTYSHEICWNTLLADARKYKMRRLTLFTLKLLHDVLGTSIPDRILPNKITPMNGISAFRRLFSCKKNKKIICKALMGEGVLKKLVLSGIFKGVKHPHVRMFVYSSLLDGPVNIGKVLLGRLFPSKGELCLRYNLNHGSSKVWLYYLMNPVILFFRKNK